MYVTIKQLILPLESSKRHSVLKNLFTRAIVPNSGSVPVLCILVISVPNTSDSNHQWIKSFSSWDGCVGAQKTLSRTGDTPIVRLGTCWLIAYKVLSILNCRLKMKLELVSQVDISIYGTLWNYYLSDTVLLRKISTEPVISALGKWLQNDSVVSH